MKFNELGLNETLVNTVEELGYSSATEVQKETIPHILNNEDVIVMSKTGTGKTAAYALPLIQAIDFTKKGVQALVLCPTRELAMQVENEFKKYLKNIEGVKTACLYGGQDINKQMSAIRGNTKVVVGTTGRILDHINRKSLWLNNVKNLVIDEADEMINMGFKEDIEIIFKILNVDSNIHMFSATIDDKLKEIARNYMINPVEILLEEDALTVDNVEELFTTIKVNMKNEATSRFIRMYKPNKAIVFCSTKKNVENVLDYLKEKDHLVEALHSDVMQSNRKEIINNFKEGYINVLVATDVASRGLDVDNLDLVINYDLPYEEEYYVHRVGRTGRNGNKGVAITYVVGGEKERLDKILKYTKSNVTYVNIPKIEDLSCKEDATKILTLENNDEKSKISINIGKTKNIRAKDILGSLVANTAIPKNCIGHIQVEDEYSTIVIPTSYVNEVKESFINKEVKKVPVTSIEILQSK